jgi:putative ABC transport system permease protein
MIRNYLKIAIRSLQKHKSFSFINIIGLSVGLASCLLIGLYINEELSYDKFHENSNRTYRVTRQFKAPDGSVGLHLSRVAPPFSEYMREDFSEIDKIGRFVDFGSLVSYQDKVFNEPSFIWADSEIADIFSFDIIEGDVMDALSSPSSVAMSKSMTLKYFGDEDPIGKIITYDNEIDLMVRAVFEDFPENASVRFELLGDFKYVNDVFGGAQALMPMWYRNMFSTFFTMKSPNDIASLKAKMPDFLVNHLGENGSVQNELVIQKLTDIHLKSNLADEQGVNSDIKYVYIFSAIALLILAIASINYMNLTTAKSANRAKEVGMRKVFGAARYNLINQFLVESILLVFMAVIIAFGITLLVLPSFRAFSGLQLDMAVIMNAPTLGLIVLFALSIGVIAGSYPAFYLTRFKILNVLKGKIASGAKSGNLRKVLVVTQFSISLILVVSTLVVFQQLNFIQNKSLGYDKDQMMIVRSNSELRENRQIFKDQLNALAGVQSVGRSIFVPTNQLLNSQGSAMVEVDGELKSTGTSLKELSVDHDFISTYKMEIVVGRNFSKLFTTDTASFILNETAIKSIGWEEPETAVGQTITYGNTRGQVIGVVKDFNFESLQSKIEPVIFTMSRRSNGAFSIKIVAENVKETVSEIEAIYGRIAPTYSIRFNFLDERFENLYSSETQRSELFTIFSGLAIFLACLGLFGLASYTVSQRGKEISIRKVLGASIKQIVGILSKEFIILIGISMILAIPVSWYFMGDWLKSYAYRISLNWTPFVIAGVIVTMIAILTISTQTFRAAITNPSKRLRDE